jgi:hypothetical protein
MLQNKLSDVTGSCMVQSLVAKDTTTHLYRKVTYDSSKCSAILLEWRKLLPFSS